MKSKTAYIEFYDDGPDRHGRRRYCLYRWRDYSPGYPAGEENIPRWGAQHFHAVPPTDALPEAERPVRGSL